MPTESFQPGQLKRRVKAAFENPDMFATSLFALYVDRFGEDTDDENHIECLTWSPATIAMELLDEFGCVIPDFNFHRLMGAIAIKTSDDFFRRPRRFIELCNILSGDDFNPEVFNPATAAEMAWGMTEALLLEPPDPGEDFDPTIKAYIGFVLEQEAIASPPDILGFATYDHEFADPLANFADDPDMYAAIGETLTVKSDEIMQMLRDNLQELVAQLGTLPLVKGSADAFVQRAQKHFQRML